MNDEYGAQRHGNCRFGAIVAASVLALVYGQSATNDGFLRLSIIMAASAAVLFIFTIFDRTLPRGRV